MKVESYLKVKAIFKLFFIIEWASVDLELDEIVNKRYIHVYKALTASDTLKQTTISCISFETRSRVMHQWSQQNSCFQSDVSDEMRELSR